MSINPCRACSLSSSQGELEGAKPASNRIKCRAKPCSARCAWSEASIFVPLRGTKITALLQAVEKSRRLFRQPEVREGSPPLLLLFLFPVFFVGFRLLLLQLFARPFHQAQAQSRAGGQQCTSQKELFLFHTRPPFRIRRCTVFRSIPQGASSCKARSPLFRRTVQHIVFPHGRSHILWDSSPLFLVELTG